jgi:AcrR family transcriptional regulator
MKPEQTQQRILEAAEALFGELGFDATTTRDIAERSGINKALIHYHFGTKDELLQVLLDGYYAQLTAAVSAPLARQLPAEEQALAVLDAYGDFLAAHRIFCCLVQREIASGRHVEQIVARTLPAFRLGTGWLQGRAPEAERVQLLTSVYGMVVTYFTHGGVLRQLTGEDPFSPDALEARKRHVRRVAALLLGELERGSKAGKRGKTWARSTRRTPRKSRGS